MTTEEKVEKAEVSEKKPLFPLGRTFVTRGVNYAMMAEDHGEQFTAFVRECLDRHQTGDWGDLCEEDKEMNYNCVDEGGRMLSCYDIPKCCISAIRPSSWTDEKVWVITEWDRSETTVLYPSEY